MRLLRMLSVIIPLVALVACGGGKATLTAISTAATSSQVAVPVPTGTVAAASAAPQRTDVPVSPAPRPAGTPTVLAAIPATATAARAPSTITAAPTPTASPRPTQPAATATQEPKSDRVADLPAGAPQQTIGATTDGLTLLNLRTGKNEGFTRLVFDLSKQDGSAAPVPRTRVWMQGTTVIVAFGGVRDDLYAQSLGGAAQPVNLGMVQSIYRIPVRDDTETAYGITLSGPAKVTLTSTTLPTRVIVDIADK